MTSHSFHLYLYGPQRGPIGQSFEQAQERLEKLPGLFFELDGSFAWMQKPGSNEIYGILYDAAGGIQYCDLHGRCTLETVRQLFHALAGDEVSGLEVLLLPERDLQDFQTFENRWSQASLD
ncbi:hypothetical protein N9C08_01505 [Rubripirellula sp.]|jgi:hypothetical protein|nr:hypothetical protein [Rubripirellula sp.]MDA9840489.1 hypothetical protein [Rubripirellula sp.]